MERNAGIDLLRLLAMFFVTVLHIQGHGGMLSSSGYSLLHSATVWGIEYAAYSAVNCFVLIAGYVGGNSRVKISRIVMLWLQVAFYSIILTGLIAVLFPGTVSRNEVLKAIFPVMKGQYWFFTAYFGMYMVVPFLNYGIQELSQLQYRIALICGALVFSVLPAFLKTDTFLMDGGYHTLWFVYLYIAGAYVKRFGIWKKCGKWRIAGIYLLAVMIGWAEKMMVTYGASRFSWGALFSEVRLFQYSAPTTLLAALALLRLFSELSFPDRLKHAIWRIAPLAFGVYLIHDHPLVRLKVIYGRFAQLTSRSVPVMVAGVMLCAMTIFLVGCIVEWCRGG